MVQDLDLAVPCTIQQRDVERLEIGYHHYTSMSTSQMPAKDPAKSLGDTERFVPLWIISQLSRLGKRNQRAGFDARKELLILDVSQ